MGEMYEVCIEMDSGALMEVPSAITICSGFQKFVGTEMHKHTDCMELT
jgi:hypothetical protein